MSIIQTKIYTPFPKKGSIPRLALIKKLNDGFFSGKRLSVLSAPAGYGKTALACDWATSASVPVGWLSIDELDCDLNRFISHFIAALSKIDEKISQSSLNLLKAGKPLIDVVASLVNDVEKFSNRFIFVMDDFHYIKSIDDIEPIRLLITNIPSNIHLVIICRGESPIEISKFRASNDLTEIGLDELSFSDTEINDFFSKTLGIKYLPKELEQLKIQSEGWIAGLQLASIFYKKLMHKERNERLNLDQSTPIFEYLIHEVYRRQPLEIRNFLLKTASMERLNNSLCQAVMEETSMTPQYIFSYLIKENLFFIPLDDKNEWYRYHHLLRDSLLRLQKNLLDPNAINDINFKISNWFEDRNSIPEALHYSKLSGRMDNFAKILEKIWTYFSENFQSSIWLEWVRNLDEKILYNRPVLLVQIAWSLMDMGKFELSELRLRQAENFLNNMESNAIVYELSQLEILEARISFVRAYNAQNEGKRNDCILHAQHVLQLTANDDSLFLRAQARAILAASFWAIGELDAAVRSLSAWIEVSKNTGNYIFSLASSCGKADLLVSQGYLKDALDVYSMALLDAKIMPEGAKNIIAHHLIGVSQVYDELQQSDLSEKFLNEALEMGELSILPDWGYRKSIAMAQRQISKVNYIAALDHLNEAIRSKTRTLVPDIKPVEALKAEVYIRQGDFTRARDVINSRNISLNDKPVYLHEFEHLLLVRIIIAELQEEKDERKTDILFNFLHGLKIFAESQNRKKSILEILKLEAILNFFVGNKPAAFDALTKILTLSKSEGYIRFFTNDSELIFPILREYRSLAGKYVKFGSDSTLYLERILSSIDGELTKSHLAINESLSQREMDVLRLIAKGHSNDEICSLLFIAIDTVKGHNRRIFEKLHVRRRTEAVVRAQKMGLI